MRGGGVGPLAWLLLLGAALPPSGALRCDRTPDGKMGGRARIDGRYFIKVSGNADSYVPNTVYTVSLQGQRNSQQPNKFTGFLLVAETESRDPVSDSFVGNQKNNDVGTFQTLGDSLTKYSEKCPNAVAHSSSLAKSEIQALWTAPPAGSGCVTIKATVVEHHDIWYMDEGPLSKTLCENVQESFDMQPPIVTKCCACDEAKYEVTFEGLWSRHTHPKDFPSNGWLTRFSDVIGASHAADYRFWDYGRHASEGLKQLAEHGSTRVLESELKAESNHIRTIIKARGISYPNLTGKTFAVFRVDNRHHLMSLVSMLDPSPDWIVGVSGLELCQPNCSWVESKVLNLYPWDAGTDGGPTYISPDQPTTPRDVIRRIRPNFPNDPRSPFYDPSGAEMKPLARLYLSRQRLYEKSCDSNGITGADEDHDADPCAVSAWSDWSPCSKTCGEGNRRRQRWYLSHARAETAGCSRRLTNRETCKGARLHCRQGQANKKHRLPSEDEPDPAQREGPCALTEWSSWSSCSSRCGLGSRVRSRKFKSKGAFKRCHQNLEARPDLQQTEDCYGDEPSCTQVRVEETTGDGQFSMLEEQSCEVGPWSDWMDCSATCGKGWRMRTRTLLANSGMEQQDQAYSRMDRSKEPWGANARPTEEKDDAEESDGDGEEEEEEEDPEPGDVKTERTGRCSKVQLVQKVACVGVLPSCDITEEEARQICSLPKLVGPCRAYVERWFFDLTTKACEPFGYTGCQGNRNNFESYQECLRVCSSYKEDLKRIDKLLSEDGEDNTQEVNSVVVTTTNQTLYDTPQQDDDPDVFFDGSLYTGLDAQNQVGPRIAGNLSSAEVTGDGSLSGYDGPTYSPGSNDIEEPQQGRHRNPNNRHKGKEQRERERNNNDQNRQRVNNRRDSREKYERQQIYPDDERRQRYPDRDNERKQRYPDGDDEKKSTFPDRSRQNDRASNEDEYVAESKFGHRQNSGTSGVIEEPVGQIKKCEVSLWSEWSECNATCGRGFERKSRFITQHPVNGGRGCPKKLLKRRKCKNLRPCRNKNSNSNEDNNYDSTNPTWGPGNPIPHARRDCIMSEWSPWSPCSESCGDGAVKQRTRSVLRPSANGGTPCAPRFDKQSCDLMPCRL